MVIRKKLIVILGPNASGKSTLAIRLAKNFDGEIISADSRQVYKGMDIGTGKVTKKERQRIPHYLLDVVSPKRRFTVAQYQKLALAAIKEIFKKGKIPILCGGSGFYIQAVVDGIVIPRVLPDWKLREKLSKKPPAELYKMLKNLDPVRARAIEKKNPRRLIRAIEIVLKTKKPVPQLEKKPLPYSILFIGIKKPPQELKKLIEKRLENRLKAGLIAEVKRLKKQGLSWQRLDDFGLEYRWVSRYLQKEISYQEMTKKLQKDIEHFAKRQMTWFRRDCRIHWIKKYPQVKRLSRKFLK
jgi:tRNA dimethylallyltransferase